jgi:hypothetical protein
VFLKLRVSGGGVLKGFIFLLGILTFNLAGCSTPTATTATSVSSIVSTQPQAWVLDSLDGSALVGASVAIQTSSGVALPTVVSGADGSVPLASLQTGVSYELVATSGARAASGFQDYVPTQNDVLGFYCNTMSLSGVPAVPPHIEVLQYSMDGVTWNNIVPSAIFSGSTLSIRISVAGVVAVRDTSWSGFGIKIDLDRIPTQYNSLVPTNYTEIGTLLTSQNDNGFTADDGRFRTTATFDLSSVVINPGAHTLDVVSYDVANNRIEKRVGILFQ